MKVAKLKPKSEMYSVLRAKSNLYAYSRYYSQESRYDITVTDFEAGAWWMYEQITNQIREYCPNCEVSDTYIRKTGEGRFCLHCDYEWIQK